MPRSWIRSLVALIAFTLLATPAGAAEPASRFADLSNGIRLHYLQSGPAPAAGGKAIVLLHGYTQTSHMWLPLMAALPADVTVIAPDLRGIGKSSKPAGHYTKAMQADDVWLLVQGLGLSSVQVVGHDIGLMVAYAFVAQHPAAVSRVVLMDAFLPGVGDWQTVWLLRDLWHFHFYGETPLALVAGRERIYLDHFWNDFAADRTKSVSEADRAYYSALYAQPGAMRSGMENFIAFEQDAKDFAVFARTKLTQPMLVLTGEKASGSFLIEQAKLVDDKVEGIVVPGSGHWLMEEAPGFVIPKLVAWLTQ